MRAPRRVARDNGYFEVWALPDGEHVRVTTEDRQYALRHVPGERARFTAATRDRLAAKFTETTTAKEER